MSHVKELDDLALVRLALIGGRRIGKRAALAKVTGIPQDRLMAIEAGAQPSKEELADLVAAVK